jgi:N6-adenosine-specific RNA methylase IME4/ParB-like chromosome segregation protein Spo0J
MTTARPIASILIGARQRSHFGDIAGLAASIESIGLLHPVVITPDGKLIAGERRIEAYKLLGRDTIPVREVDIDAVVFGEMAENEVRKDFTMSERVAIGRKVEAEIGKRQGQRTDRLVQNIGEVAKGEKTDAIAAKRAGFGNPETYRQAKTVTTKGAEELVTAVDDKTISISAGAEIAAVSVERQRNIIAALQRDADGRLTPDTKKALAPVMRELRAEKMAALKTNREAKHRAIHAAAIGKMVLERPGPFSLLYGDPPYKFEVYSELGMANSPDMHYPTLTYGEIADFRVAGIPIREIAHKDAALFLWCTSSNMFAARDIMTAWGFEFSSSAIWDKQKIGLGYIFRNRHEVLLYGVRGNMPGPQYQPPSVFTYPRGRHSAKPPEIRAIIERMYPDFDETTRLELFARDKVPGWTVYGLEAQPPMMDAAAE